MPSGLVLPCSSGSERILFASHDVFRAVNRRREPFAPSKYNSFGFATLMIAARIFPPPSPYAETPAGASTNVVELPPLTGARCSGSPPCHGELNRMLAPSEVSCAPPIDDSQFAANG